jgi:putative NADH-flavin reductase
MKNILVLGATGGTGLEVVMQALASNYAVTAIVRDPAHMEIKNPYLTIVKGDVLSLPSIQDAFNGKDVVISCLGTGTSLKPTTIYSSGMQNILAAMKQANVNRLICISAGALYTNTEMGVFTRLLTRVVLQNILKYIYADMRLMENQVNTSSMLWTIIRPPMLKDKPMQATYRVAINRHLRRPFSIARADLAHYIINNLETTETYRAIVEIAY